MMAITSFSPSGYEIYGRKFLESAVKYWPTEIIVYYEEKPDFEHPKVSYYPLFDVYGLIPFLKYCHSNPIYCGNVGSGYDFNRDAAKFCRKAFSQFDVLQHKTGKIFWLDADIVFKKEVPVKFLNEVFDEKTIAILIREGLHAESGFVGFDTDKGDFQHFLKTYIDLYRKGTLFKERYWIDGHAIQKAVFDSLVSFNNLSPDFPKNGLNVLPYSVLNEYMIHNKGNRKFNNA